MRTFTSSVISFILAHPLLTRYNFWTRYTPVIIFGYCTFVSKNKINWEKLFEYARESELDNALYYTLYHCQLIFGNIIPNDIYVTWDMQKVKEISNTIYDRWFTRNTLIPVGKWTTDFMERVFDDDRKNEALLSFYNDYINKVLFSGSYFKVIDILQKTDLMRNNYDRSKSFSKRVQDTCAEKGQVCRCEKSVLQ